MASYRVQARVGVAAPASAVWRVVSDLPGWSEWNALYPEAEGRLSIGALIQLRRVLGDKGERFDVRVVDWVPNAQIVWLRIIAPFARSLGYIEIDPLTERGCILAAGEIFQGWLGPMIGKRMRRELNKGLMALCEAAKARSEATWDGVPDEPVPPPPPPPEPKMKMNTIQMSLRGSGKK
jgi:hypothetical protein